MFDSRQTNNNNYKKSASTPIRTLYGDMSALGLSYWGDKFSVRFYPFKGANADGVRTYDYQSKISTAVTVEKCLALVSEVKKTIVPALDRARETGMFNKDIVTSVEISGGTTRLAIEVRKAESDAVPYVYLVLYTGINPQDGIAQDNSKFTYKFTKTVLEKNYDPTTGTSEKEYLDTEFEYFWKKMEETATTLGTAAHSVNNDAATKSTYNSNGNNGGYNKGNYAANTQTPATPSYSAPVSQFNPDEFPFM